MPMFGRDNDNPTNGVQPESHMKQDIPEFPPLRSWGVAFTDENGQPQNILVRGHRIQFTPSGGILIQELVWDMFAEQPTEKVRGGFNNWNSFVELVTTEDAGVQ